MNRDLYLRLPSDDDREMILDTVAQLAREVVAPASEEIDAQGKIPAEVREAIAEGGLFGLAASEALGGVGMDAKSVFLTLVELAEADRSVALDFMMGAWIVLPTLAEAGTEDEAVAQAEEIVGGAVSAAFAHDERGGGIELSTLETHAEDKGDQVLINGAKHWVVGGPDCDEILVSAREGDGYSLFLVPASSEGVQRGDREDRLGFRGIAVGEIRFKDVSVSTKRRVGLAGEGQDILRRLIARQRMGLVALGAGIAGAASDDAARYATERRQFDRPIADFEAIRERLAKIEAARGTALAVGLAVAGMIDVGGDATHMSEIAQYQVARATMDAADHALQVFGGYGYSAEYPAERHYRDARWIGVAAGGVDSLAIRLAGRVLPG